MRRKVILTAIFITSILLALISGRYSVPLKDYLEFFPNLVHYYNKGTYESPGFVILYAIRLPRIILALSVGAGLSIAGYIFQQLFKNPIASPDILGVSSGASFGAALAMVVAVNVTYLVQVSSFLFGLFAVFLVYLLKRLSKNENILYLVLSGIIVSAFFSALLSLVKYMADPYQQLPSIVFWTMGGLYKANYQNALLCLGLVIIFGYIFERLSYKISILTVDSDLAKTMGIHVEKLRNIILIMSALMVSICVSFVGVIGWIALIIPHIARLLNKNNKQMYYVTGIIGGISLLLIDTLSRSLLTTELPVGILTALIGAPILGYLILVRKTI